MSEKGSQGLSPGRAMTPLIHRPEAKSNSSANHNSISQIFLHSLTRQIPTGHLPKAEMALDPGNLKMRHLPVGKEQEGTL